jgi:hypothetical protein
MRFTSSNTIALLAISLPLAIHGQPSTESTVNVNVNDNFLSNGHAVIAGSFAEPGDFVVPDASLVKRDFLSCSGPSLCRTMSANDCDEAKTMIVPGKVYYTDPYDIQLDVHSSFLILTF